MMCSYQEWISFICFYKTHLFKLYIYWIYHIIMPSFIEELKKQKVFNSVTMYLATAFVILQTAGIIIPALLVPDWALRFLVVLAILGFPVVIIFSWIYDSFIEQPIAMIPHFLSRLWGIIFYLALINIWGKIIRSVISMGHLFIFTFLNFINRADSTLKFRDGLL